MQISVNHQLISVPDNSSLIQILAHFDTASLAGIAIAVNDLVISKIDWAVTYPRITDQITVIKATQGG